MTPQPPRLNLLPDVMIPDDALLADIAGTLRAACVEFGILDTLAPGMRLDAALVQHMREMRQLLATIQYTANGRSTDERDNYNRLVEIDQLIHAALKSSEPGA